jgi:hypothetical protein
MFRLTIRELMLITLLAAVVLGWIVDHSQWVARSNGQPGFLDRMIDVDVHRSIAKTMESQANDCWESLKNVRKENQTLRDRLAALEQDPQPH